jgi:formylglycine-generating enzyme required for sulfatase activity
MEQGFIDIITRMYKEQGAATLTNPAQFKRFFSDYVGANYGKEAKLFRAVVEAGAGKFLAEAAKPAAIKSDLVKRLEDEHGLSPKFTAEFVDLLGLVLRGDASKTVVGAQTQARQVKAPASRPAPSEVDTLKRELEKARAEAETARAQVELEKLRAETARAKVEAARLAAQTASVQKTAPVPADMVLIPAGTFIMGADALPGDGYTHQVTISKPFYMGKYEVTQRAWTAVIGNNPCNWKGENLPVECVSWFDAIEYCNKRSVKEGLSPAYTVNGKNVTWNKSADGYRLPTEEEWEYAAQNTGKDNYKYPGSNNVDSVAWYNGNSDGKTHPVGMKAPNGLGLYDMCGNVWELCWDIHDPFDHGGPLVSRICRGGSWDNVVSYVRSCRRGIYWTPSDRKNTHGLRVVRSAQ